jgi:hypothetical protein
LTAGLLRLVGAGVPLEAQDPRLPGDAHGH